MLQLAQAEQTCRAPAVPSPGSHLCRPAEEPSEPLQTSLGCFQCSASLGEQNLGLCGMFWTLQISQRPNLFSVASFKPSGAPVLSSSPVSCPYLNYLSCTRGSESRGRGGRAQQRPGLWERKLQTFPKLHFVAASL